MSKSEPDRPGLVTAKCHFKLSPSMRLLSNFILAAFYSLKVDCFSSTLFSINFLNFHMITGTQANTRVDTMARRRN
ncbi:hypothetical protein FGO68_gene11455 [Halteria grandinella]|uniref:Uncharacterized protein n=1 Tax=Halteria grandinella TaxID=5974 RepID=A0A8J8NW64_HALGN|nr:hypothetical protein FGO68_gene11455 [Halteria grandinella]